MKAAKSIKGFSCKPYILETYVKLAISIIEGGKEEWLIKI